MLPPSPTRARCRRRPSERSGREQLGGRSPLGAAVDGPRHVALPPVLLDGLDGRRPDAREPASREPPRRRGAGAARPTCSTRRRPSPSTPVDAFSPRAVQGEDVLDAALPGASVRRSAWLVLEPRQQPAAAMLRNLGFRLLVLTSRRYDGVGRHHRRLPRPDARRRRSTSAAARRCRAMVVDPLGALLDTGAARATSASARPSAAVRIVGRAASSPARSSAPTCAAASCWRRRRLRRPDGGTVAALDRLRRESPALRAGAAVRRARRHRHDGRRRRAA